MADRVLAADHLFKHMNLMIEFSIALPFLGDFTNRMHDGCVISAPKIFPNLWKTMLRQFLREIHGDLSW